jgi:hypothetical protein
MHKAVAPAFRRLFDAQSHWHRGLDNYFSPDEFRRAVNACIQEVRNVTFVLQNSKHDIPNFETWYSPWQEKMRNTEFLRWLVEARNKVVKKGDLDLNSLLKVSVVHSYIDNEVPSIEFELTPSLSTAEVFQFLDSKHVPSSVLERSYIKLERKWVDKENPEQELLQMLGDCWNAIASLLRDAPETSNADVGTPEIFNRLPPCMYQGSESRSLWLRVQGDELVPVHFSETEVQCGNEDEIRSRYSDSPMFRNSTPPKDFKQTCELFFQQAMYVLKKDKHHVHLALLFVDSVPAKFMQLNNEVRADKYRSMRLVASEAEAIGADSMIMIGEVWRAPFDRSNPNRFAVDSPHRTEALSLVGATKDGQGISLDVSFRREGDDIIFGTIERSGIEGNNMIAPILTVWQQSC